MSKYITHRRYRKIGACGETFNIPYGKELQTIGEFICKDDKPVCAVTSQDAYEYFAQNNDGQGLRRGELTYRIAFSPRNRDGFRFTSEERLMIETEYSKFLRKDCDFLIFNYEFFNAPIEELEELAKRLE